MLYKKNNELKLNKELFENPTSEYRCAPFWAWNTKLEKDELLRQIDCLKEMGMGGFHMHSRSGMATEYLSDEFMELIRACVDKAEDKNMLAWLYDEDRWPSGSAGGYITKDPRYRQKFLYFTTQCEETVSMQEGFETGKPSLVACFDIVLNEGGELESYKPINACDNGDGTKWYVYLKTPKPSGWYNNQTYIDTLCPQAMNEFIKITYESYKNAIGDRFDKSVPAIFTDEPQFCLKDTLSFADSKEGVMLPWTTDFADTFNKAYGINIIEFLPELIWEKTNGEVSKARYLYHDHICERFTEAFADNCGKWCSDNNLMLTGHMVEEPTLWSQTRAIGEAMRAYRSFGLPGIDMLCDGIELSTAKQTQSAVHQYGKEGMMSELYGVTNWDFDFRGHKLQGDWQAALGVTVRVPHLSWVSMKGSAKRDYPASISFQSPWYKEYPYVENHFARLNTAMTRGKANVDVAVIHPIESYWLHWGPSENTAGIREQMEQNFQNTISWLLFGLIDFDFISESLLPAQCGKISDTLQVGNMKYKTVVVPACETLRSTTLDALEKFSAAGGKIVFMGDCPRYVNAEKSDKVKALYDRSRTVSISGEALLSELEDNRFIDIRNSDGTRTDNLIYNLRDDNDCKWLFIAHAKHPKHKDVMPAQDITIRINGEFKPVLYDTINGNISDISYEIAHGKTVIKHPLYAYDSLLLSLVHTDKASLCIEEKTYAIAGKIDFRGAVSYRREEDNVLLLDEGEYSVNDGDFAPREDIFKIDVALREKLGYPLANGADAQPWVLPDEKPSHFVTMKFEFDSEIVTDAKYAFEEAYKITFNGEDIPIKPEGYFVDPAIKTITLPKIKKGKNELIVKMPLTKRIGIEPSYILGDFDVALCGVDKIIKAKTDKIGFGSITAQGMPFYGGNTIYSSDIDTPDCTLEVKANFYRGHLIKVLLDGKDVGNIVYNPYTIRIEDVKAGCHKIEFILYGNRLNTFGALHDNSGTDWFGSNCWYPDEESTVYEYLVKDTGILSSPVIKILK